MKAKATVLLGLKVIVLTFILFGLYAVDFLGLSPSASLRTGLVEETQAAPATLLLVSLLHAAVLSWPILRSRWTGWRLVAAIFLVFYGVTTLMVAIEAVYLPEALPLDLVVRLVVNGAITAAVFSVLAVLIQGRMSGVLSLSKGGGEEPQEANRRLAMPFDRAQGMPWTQWVWKLALIGFSWVFLFILFGALVFLPLAGRLAPAALEEYTNMEMPAWILPFQALRAVLWAALTLPVIRMMRGRWWETGLAVALLFSVLMGGNLLRPTGLPVGLQVAHLVEVFGENLLFGWIVVWLLHRRHGRNVPATA
jgi:hypothetical protein